MNARLVAVGLLLIVVSGCVHPSYVVSRDVPESPTFVVLSGSADEDEVEYANRMTSYLIAAGVRVVDLPASREAVSAESQSDREKDPPILLLEQFQKIRAVDPDYILWTDVEYHRLKFVKRPGGEVLASIVLRNPRPSEEEEQFREALVSLGIPVETK